MNIRKINMMNFLLIFIILSWLTTYYYLNAYMKKLFNFDTYHNLIPSYNKEKFEELELFKTNLNFEQTRRKLFDNVKEVSFYINAQLNNIQNTGGSKNVDINFLKSDFQNRINIILAQLYNISVRDIYGKWRQHKSRNLANLVQNKFFLLQNPKNCTSSKKILCNLNKPCGFGCQMHHLIFCFITAYATNRVMIMDSSDWLSNNNEGYERFFKPLSINCQKLDSKNEIVDWNEKNSSNSNVIHMPIDDNLLNKPPFLPLNIPKEFEKALKLIHGDPFVWWAGQIIKYLMRFNQNFKNKVNQTIKFQKPCVGVHVRRTDKIGTEAAFHNLDEYMIHVNQFYNFHEYANPNLPKIRNVYLASDDIQVYDEAQSKYPNYNFIFNKTYTKKALSTSRNQVEGIESIIIDVYFLAQCNYLVCTFSSNVCRLAYALLQTNYPDGSWRFKSLDDVYYFIGSHLNILEVIYDHKARKDLGEIDLKVGDFIALSGNHWDGYSKGVNMRTNEKGLFPSYKVKTLVKSFTQ